MFDAYVIGDGLPELAAALELAEVGLRIRISVPSDAPAEDSVVASGRDRVRDPEGEPDPDGVLAGFLGHIAAPLAQGGPEAAEARPVAVPPVPVLLRGARGGWAPQPEPAILGIPAVPLSAEAIALLGGGGAVRAYLDRIKPVLTVGKTQALGDLVRARLGRTALVRLVEPLVRERFGVAASEVDVAVAAPGLNEALTRVGSLSGAVLSNHDRDVARETRVRPSGGWERLDAILRERLALYDVEYTTSPVERIDRDDDGWSITEIAESGERATADGPHEIRTRSIVSGRESAAMIAAAAVTGVTSATGAGAVPAAPTALVGEPDTGSLRVWARIEVEDPVVPDDHPGRDAVETIVLADGEPWSVRIRRDEGGRSWALLAGPTTTIEAPEEEAAARDSRIGDVLEGAGLRRRVGGSAERGTRTAPFASAAQRDTRILGGEERRRAHPDLLEVGAHLHGGALADAVADARIAAVALRRRLAGIAE